MWLDFRRILSIYFISKDWKSLIAFGFGVVFLAVATNSNGGFGEVFLVVATSRNRFGEVFLAVATTSNGFGEVFLTVATSSIWFWSYA